MQKPCWNQSVWWTNSYECDLVDLLRAQLTPFGQPVKNPRLKGIIQELVNHRMKKDDILRELETRYEMPMR